MIKDKFFIIVDWKTNKAPIKFESGWWEKDRDGKLTGVFVEKDKRFKYPLSTLADSIGNHYTLQLSAYNYLAEQFGLINQGNVLYHIRQVNTFEEKVEPVVIKYLKEDIYKLFNHHQLSKNRDKIEQYKLI